MISYGGPDSSVIASQPALLSDRPTKVTTSKNETWIATATYAETISVLEIMSGVSGIDMGEELSSVGLSALRQVINISLSNLALVLTRKPDETSFTFDAHVKYIFFDGPVHLACSKSTSWTYSFTFGLSSDNFLSSLGIQGISLTNSTISLSNAPVTGSLLVNTVSTSGLNVTFAGTLIFTDSLAGLAKVTGNPSLHISGSVSDSAFTLAASTSDISLFNGMNLAGNLFISYSISSKQLVAAIEGNILFFSCSLFA
ncbi:hypothetical protein M378DRAFT_395659 [Amanita muscaria Koide BX008]|uniref:Uncharacterized protein n=1 Tax=Amanita muscaria (strain Koide BX008) TaxID=946122 RepID=A0A0C2WM94_AMAMK|nr:hypothetical protein M378DRAFT_395659 [Amanita muscaria Koide BX008]